MAGAGKQPFGGTESAQTVAGAGKQAFCGTEDLQTAIGAGKLAFGGTEDGKTTIRAGKQAFGGTKDIQTAVRTGKLASDGTEISETAGSAAKERRRWQLARLQEICGTATPLPKWQGQRLPLERTGGGRLLCPPPEGPTASSPQGLASGPFACRQAEQQ